MEGTLTAHTPEWEVAHDELLLKTYAEFVGKEPSQKLWQKYGAVYEQYGTHSAAFSSLGLPSKYWQQYFVALDEKSIINQISECMAPRPN